MEGRGDHRRREKGGWGANYGYVSLRDENNPRGLSNFRLDEKKERGEGSRPNMVGHKKQVGILWV